MTASRRVMIYDATDTRPGVELADAWLAGSWLYRAFRSLDICQGFGTWKQALDWLESLGPVDSVQYWGHGSPGAVWLGGQRLDVNELARVRVRDLFWLRTCASFAGEKGQELARDMSSVLGCRVAGHTFNIGPLQSGLHSLAPGDEPGWLLAEGLGENGRPTWSRPWSPNTVTFLHSSFPKEW
jgi:hypothetical protein